MSSWPYTSKRTNKPQSRLNSGPASQTRSRTSHESPFKSASVLDFEDHCGGMALLTCKPRSSLGGQPKRREDLQGTLRWPPLGPSAFRFSASSRPKRNVDRNVHHQLWFSKKWCHIFSSTLDCFYYNRVPSLYVNNIRSIMSIFSQKCTSAFVF